MAYLTTIEKLSEDEEAVEYAYTGSGWDGSAGSGRFKINKVTGDIFVTEDTSRGEPEKYAERGIGAALKERMRTGYYPEKSTRTS